MEHLLALLEGKITPLIAYPGHTVLHLFETISDGKLFFGGTSFHFSEEKCHTFRYFMSQKRSDILPKVTKGKNSSSDRLNDIATFSRELINRKQQRAEHFNNLIEIKLL